MAIVLAAIFAIALYSIAVDIQKLTGNPIKVGLLATGAKFKQAGLEGLGQIYVATHQVQDGRRKCSYTTAGGEKKEKWLAEDEVVLALDDLDAAKAIPQ